MTHIVPLHGLSQLTSPARQVAIAAVIGISKRHLMESRKKRQGDDDEPGRGDNVR
jgi:hypothetical protein